MAGKIWWCRNCGYETTRGGRCEDCGGDLAASPLPELEARDDKQYWCYTLAGWDNPMHVRLIDALIGANIAHRFDDGEEAEDQLVVSATDEPTVTRIINEVLAANSPASTRRHKDLSSGDLLLHAGDPRETPMLEGQTLSAGPNSQPALSTGAPPLWPAQATGVAPHPLSGAAASSTSQPVSPITDVPLGPSNWVPLVLGLLFFAPIGFVMSIWRLAKHYGTYREVIALLVSGAQILAVVVVIAVSANGSGTGGSSTAVAMGTAIPFSFSNGATVSITVDNVVEPATAVPYQSSPSPGDEYVGVKVIVDNTGSANALVDLGPITSLTDSSGQAFTWNPTTLADCPALGDFGVATVGPGASDTGCIAFEVPSGDTFSQVSIGSSGRTPGVWDAS